MSMDTAPQPDTERSLDSDVREFIQRKRDHIVGAYEPIASDENKEWDGVSWDGPVDYYRSEREQILSPPEFKWVFNGSERVTACIGRTLRGSFVFEDQTGLVIQFQPKLAYVNDIERVEFAANANEIAIWKLAVERGDTDLFADVIDYAPDGTWVAREYCTPINPSTSLLSHGTMERLAERSHVKAFKEKFTNRGWSGNYTGGNIGMTTAGDVVLLDAGCHTDPPEPVTPHDHIAPFSEEERDFRADGGQPPRRERRGFLRESLTRSKISRK